MKATLKFQVSLARKLCWWSASIVSLAIRRIVVRNPDSVMLFEVNNGDHWMELSEVLIRPFDLAPLIWQFICIRVVCELQFTKFSKRSYLIGLDYSKLLNQKIWIKSTKIMLRGILVRGYNLPVQSPCTTYLWNHIAQALEDEPNS